MTGLVLIGKHIKECLTMFGVKILTQIVDMEFIKTNKKSKLLVIEGCGFIRHRWHRCQRTDGASSWCFCITKCKSSVRLRNEQIEDITVRSQLFDPADIEKRKLPSALKDTAVMADTDETLRQTKFAAQKDSNRKTAANIPGLQLNPGDS